MLVLGCGGESERSVRARSGAGGSPGMTAGTSGVGAAMPTGAGGAPSFPGCRAPNEPGCDVCCVPGPTCDRYNASPRTDWYSAEDNTGCPEDCAPCATCFLRDEENLRALGCRPECDCTAPPSEDPCFVPSDCDCFCHTKRLLVARCPGVSACE
jgi:hypothetical protein